MYLLYKYVTCNILFIYYLYNIIFYTLFLYFHLLRSMYLNIIHGSVEGCDKQYSFLIIFHFGPEEVNKNNKIHQDSPRFTNFHKDSQRFTKIHKDSQRFTNIHQLSPTFTKIHKDSQRFTKIHKDSQRFTKIHKDSQRFTKIHKDSQRFTKIHKDSPRFTKYVAR